MRINKYLSDAGVCSRRKADEHILNGKIKIYGRVAVLGDTAEESDKVTFKERPVNLSENKIIYALYKPRGIISTASDERGRKNVLDLVPKSPRVYPVGRLDKESEGLMLLTNDGDFAHKLSHPKHGSEKEYQVTFYAKRDISKDLIVSKLIKGMLIDGVIMKAKNVEILKSDGNRHIVNLVLTTGHNRQIRKMCDKIGLVIAKLERIRISNLKINDLKIKPGEYKKISIGEIQYDN